MLIIMIMIMMIIIVIGTTMIIIIIIIGTLSLWGFDYKFTNYKFKKENDH